MRQAGVDVLKVGAIVAVVMEHSHRPYFVLGRDKWEEYVSEIGAVCTPIFLIVSGYLTSLSVRKLSSHCSEGDLTSLNGEEAKFEASLLKSRRRTLERLLLPYLVASIIGILFPRNINRKVMYGADLKPIVPLEPLEDDASVMGTGETTMGKHRFVRLLLEISTLGELEEGVSKLRMPGPAVMLMRYLKRIATFKVRGIYYYVFIASVCAAFSPRMCKLSKRGLAALFIAWLVAKYFTDAICFNYDLPANEIQYSVIRNFGFYLGGYACGAHLNNWKFFTSHRNIVITALALWSVTVIFLHFGFNTFTCTPNFNPAVWDSCDFWRPLDQTFRAFLYFAISICSIEIAGSSSKVPYIFRLVSDLTYPIYLYHIYFIELYYSFVTAPLGIQDYDRDKPTAQHFFGRVITGLTGGMLLPVLCTLALGKDLSLKLFGARFSGAGN